MERGLQWVTVIATAVGLKFFYSSASVDELKWVLFPTASMVEFVTSERFTFESHAGYMKGDHSFLIAASCSGMNFLITAFMMLAVQRLWGRHRASVSWWFLPAGAAAAYGTTIVANSVRISTALWMRRLDLGLGLSQDGLHRLEGIYVYFGFLFLLFVLSEQFGSRARQTNAQWSGCGRLALPLLIYWATTLGIPLANGARGSAFWQHALVVLLAPIPLLLPPAIYRFLKSRPSYQPPCLAIE